MSENRNPSDPDVEEPLTLSPSVTLQYHEWRAKTPPRAAVLIVHGFAEHAQRYSRFARSLNAFGFHTAGFDHRGMGRSSGVRGFVRDYSEYAGDVETIRRRMMRDLPEQTPCIIYGHSMGGLVSLLHAENFPHVPVAGTILSGPMLGILLRVPGWQVALGRLVAGFLPRFSFPVKLNPTRLTHDEEDQARLLSDPYILKQVTVAWFFASSRAMQQGKADIGKVTWPTLWLIPGEDRVCSAAASREVFNSMLQIKPPAASVSVEAESWQHQWRDYPGLFHEIHNERAPDRERVSADVRDWIEERLSSLQNKT